jgi:peptidyl-prolyl cis-trans isomerase C
MSCANHSHMKAEPVLEIVPIRVDGVEITEADIAREMQHHPAASLAEARAAATRALVVRELLLQEARRQGADDEEEPAEDDLGDDPRIAALIAREIRCPEPDDESCRRYFDNNRAKFGSPALFEARHILLASPADEPEERAAGKALAAEIIASLQADPDCFAELAARHSACPSGKQEGRLGLLSRGDTVPEFETYLFSLKAGELCPLPVETRYGVHVIQLDRKVDAVAAEFEDSRDAIARYLRTQSLHTATRQYIMLLAGQAKIEGVEIEAAHSPLVQ